MIVTHNWIFRINFYILYGSYKQKKAKRNTHKKNPENLL